MKTKSFKVATAGNTDPDQFPAVQEERKVKNSIAKRRAKNKVAKASRRINR